MALSRYKHIKKRIFNPGLNRPLFFVHIPKCAGTSFKNFIEENLANWRTEIVRPKEYNDLERDLPDGFHIANMTRSENVRFRLLRPRKNRVVMGHVCFYEYMKGLNYSFATFLRNPVDRIVSHYYYFHEDDTDFESLVGWMNDSKSELNLQTAFLCGNPKTELSRMDLEMAKVNLHFFDFIGLVEQYDLSVQLFCRIYDISLPDELSVLNVNLRQTYRQREIPQRVSDLIAERSCYDVELYEHASKLFKEKLRAAGLIEDHD